jgi:hypothetical protein
MAGKFKDILDKFKKDEAEESVVALTDDVQLRNGFLAWDSVNVQRKNDGDECPHDDTISQWKWLWENVEFNQNQFGIVANVRPHEILNLLARLKGLKLIYPDGTQNENAKKYLRAVIQAKIKNASKDRKKA